MIIDTVYFLQEAILLIMLIDLGIQDWKYKAINTTKFAGYRTILYGGSLIILWLSSLILNYEIAILGGIFAFSILALPYAFNFKAADLIVLMLAAISTPLVSLIAMMIMFGAIVIHARENVGKKIPLITWFGASYVISAIGFLALGVNI